MKKRRKKIVLTKDGKKLAAGAAAGVLLLALLLFFALFKAENILVVGSTRYSDEEIRQMAMGSPLDSNTLLAVWFHRHQKAEDVPFVESFDLEMVNSHSIRIHVNEKDIIGYVAKDGQKLYFDKDGNVVETEAQKESEVLKPEEARQELETLRQEAEQQEALDAQQKEEEGDQDKEDTGEESDASAQQVQVLEPEVSAAQEDGSSESRAAVTDVPLILGLDMQNVQLGEKIAVKDDGIFNTILGITRMVEKYQILPECVLFDENYNITLVYYEGNIHCQLGQDNLLEEKITRVAALLPQLENLTGILHLEDYTEETVNIFFSEESLYTLKLTVAEAEGILDNAEGQNGDAQADGNESGQDTSTGEGSVQTDGNTGEGSGQTDGNTEEGAGQTGESTGEDTGQADDSAGDSTDPAGSDVTSGNGQTAGSNDADSNDTDSNTAANSGNGQNSTGTGRESGTGSSSSGIRELVGG